MSAVTYAEFALMAFIFTLMYCIVATLQSWPV